MTLAGVGPEGSLGIHGTPPCRRTLRKQDLPDILRRVAAGPPDDDLAADLMPLKHCAKAKTQLPANFSRDRYLSLGRQAGVCGCHGDHITQVMQSWSSRISGLFSQ